MNIGPDDALLVVDVQNDFCAGGSLAVPDADAIVPVINGLVPRFEHRAFSRDWHPEDHCSFSDNPEFVDGSWPAHCVRDTPGAAFHPGLDVPEEALVVDKATDAGREAYSGFEGASLAGELRSRGVTRVFVCGLATDYCVKATVLDAVRNGFETVLVADACRGVDIPAGAAAAAVDEMKAAGATVCASGSLQ